MQILRLKVVKKIDPLTSVVTVSLAIYATCMIVAPFIIGDFRWAYVQSVWDRWQGFNVGVLALASSVVALKISNHRLKIQQAQNLKAAKALLPASLSEICELLTLHSEIYKDLFEGKISEAHYPSRLKVTPTLRENFSDCIKLAQEDAGRLLVEILSIMQVFDARSNETEIRDQDPSLLDKYHIIKMLLSLAEIRVRVNKLFPWARGLEDIAECTLSMDDFTTAYLNLDINVENYSVNETLTLAGFTKSRIEEKRV